MSLNLPVLFSHGFRSRVIFFVKVKYIVFYGNVHLEEKTLQLENFWQFFLVLFKHFVNTILPEDVKCHLHNNICKSWLMLSFTWTRSHVLLHKIHIVINIRLSFTSYMAEVRNAVALT